MGEEFGSIEIRLGQLMKERGMNKSTLSHAAGMNSRQIDNYCNNSIVRLDGCVLCKICTVLGCGIGDLLVFYPPGTATGKRNLNV